MAVNITPEEFRALEKSITVDVYNDVIKMMEIHLQRGYSETLTELLDQVKNTKAVSTNER